MFRDVLLGGDEVGLIGKELFALDGGKLPSNAAKEWSGTRAAYQKKIEQMERAVRYLPAQHRARDASETEPQIATARLKQIDTLQAAVTKVQGVLQRPGEKVGATGRGKKSNITDTESAKRASSKGGVQGYDGVAVVDGKHQIVGHAAASGEGQEHGWLKPLLEATRETFRELALAKAEVREAALGADAGFHSEENIKYLFATGIDGYVADPLCRKREPRCKDAERQKPTRESDPVAKPKKEVLFQPTDFRVEKDCSACPCPAGQRLSRNGRHHNLRGVEAVKLRGTPGSCGTCRLRSKCLKHPERTLGRQVAIFLGRAKGHPQTSTAGLKRTIDSEIGRYRYSRRLGIVEPVRANIRSTHNLSRFSLPGRRKVNTPWLMYCLVHHIGKVQRYGAIERRLRRRERAAEMKTNHHLPSIAGEHK